MFKTYSLLFFFLLIANFGFGQTKEIDSLKSVLEKTNSDTTRINAQLALSKKYMSIDIDTFNLYTKMARKLSLRNHNHELARIYCSTGLGYIYGSQIDSARFYFDKALEILDKKENNQVRAAVYSNYGMSYQSSDDFEMQIAYNLKVLELLESPHDLGLAHYNQGIYYSQGDLLDLSKKHFKLGYEYSKKGNNNRAEGMALMGLGHIYIYEKKLDSAEIYLNKGLVLCAKTKNPQICYEINNKLGLLYVEQGRHDKAHSFLLAARDYAIIRKVDGDMANSLVNLGYHELKRENYQKSIEYFKEYDEFLEETNGSVRLDINMYRFWSDAEAKVGNFSEANRLLVKYVDIKDSILTKENRELLTDSEAKFESVKKDKEILSQQLALEKSKSKTRTMSILIVSLLSASILLWFLFQQRQRRIQQQLVTIQREQEVRTLESLMEGEEKERFRIAKELHDGVNGDLSAIKFKLSSLLEMNNTVIKEAVAMIDNSCEQVRAISHNLVPPSLKDFNLVEAVDEYCQSMNSIHDPEVHFQQVGDSINLDKKQEANMFRIIQELVTNSIKHAGAKEVNVQLSHLENTLQLTVEDNGKGFDPKTVKSNGIGMQNVQSRVDYLNATMDFISNEKGTSYTIAMNTKTA